MATLSSRSAQATPAPAELAALAVFPLPNVVLLPGALLPLHVFEPRYRELARDVLDGSRLLAVAQLRPGFEADYYGRPPVHDVCGLGRVIRHRERTDGRYDMLVEGVRRVRVLEELPADRAYRQVRVELLQDEVPGDLASLEAWHQKLHSLWPRLGPNLPESLREWETITEGAASSSVRADRIGHALLGDPDERQRFLEELRADERFCMLVRRAEQLVSATRPHSVLELN